MKEKLEHELRSLRFSSERREAVLAKSYKKTKRQWQYQAVIVAYIAILVLFTATLLLGDHANSNMTAAMERSDYVVLNILSSRWVRIVLIIVVCIIIQRLLVKWYSKKRMTKFATCPHCDTELTYKQAFRTHWRGGFKGHSCASCGKTYYISRPSAQKASIVGFIIYPAIFLIEVLDLGVIGFIIGLISVLAVGISVSPYAIELQEKDPNSEPIKPLW